MIKCSVATDLVRPSLKRRRRSKSLGEPKKKHPRSTHDDDHQELFVCPSLPSSPLPVRTRRTSKIETNSQKQVHFAINSTPTPAMAYALLSAFRNGLGISFTDFQKLLSFGVELFTPQPNVRQINPPKQGEKLVIVGDLHGQFYDLFDNILSVHGLPMIEDDYINKGRKILFRHKIKSCNLLTKSNVTYIFNGDFVDRGRFSVQTFCSLLALALAFPDSVYLNRGNHEEESTASVYGFFDEISAKYVFSEALALQRDCTRLFKSLPIATVVKGYFFIVHGGLSKKITSLDIINKPNRTLESSIISNLLWSDPMNTGVQRRSVRGIGVRFGPGITKTLLNNTNLKLLIRSHEWQNGGIDVCHEGKVVTVFSAPNYYGEESKGSVLVFEKKGEDGSELGYWNGFALYSVSFDLADAPDEPDYFNVQKLYNLLEEKQSL
ncbi:hypothetical protein P9112_010406 [Eukaryota sp. TZLM1-RC]